MDEEDDQRNANSNSNVLSVRFEVGSLGLELACSGDEHWNCHISGFTPGGNAFQYNR